MAIKKPKPLNKYSFHTNSRETIQNALRLVSDGVTPEETAKTAGVKTSTIKTWMRKFSVLSESFLSDLELDNRLSNYNDNTDISKKVIPEPKWEGMTPKPTEYVSTPIVVEEEEEPELPALSSEEPKEEKPKVKILGEGLSDQEREQIAKSIRFSLGEKTVNDLHNAVTALVAGTTERIKHVENHTEAIQMVSSAIALKQLTEILDAPPMAMNWNDVSKIIGIIREANDMNVVEKKEKAPTQAAPEQLIPEAKRQINVTILAQRPPKYNKTIDVSVSED